MLPDVQLGQGVQGCASDDERGDRGWFHRVAQAMGRSLDFI